ncbi:MAG TPA: C39 family peptidase, partial [Chloroflexota bacterium]|nr:C39 family peptidase [Chloroflexota bacterium]
MILPMLLALSIWPAHAAAAATAPFDGWTFRGTVVSGNAVQLAPSSAPLACAPEDVDGGGAAYDPTIGLCRGDSGVFGVMTGPRTTSADSFQQLVGSWNAVTPPGTWLELHARLLQAPGWSGWYSLGVWASDGSTIQRHSVPNQADDRARVETDTLIAADGLLAGGYQLAVTLYAASPDVTPAVRLVTAATTSQSAPAQRLNSGVELTVPKRSQMHPEYQGLGFGGGGEAWCSPTSTSMLMAYWANILNLPQLNLPVPQVAAGTYDQAYNGAGNWPFNM